MPNTSLIKYILSQIRDGVEFEDIIAKVSRFNPDTFGWGKLENTIDLKRYFLPTVNTSPTGNYVITRYTNGPTRVTKSPILLKVQTLTFNGTASTYSLLLDGASTYIRDCSSITNDWINLSTLDSNGDVKVKISTSLISPTDRTNPWIDTSGSDPILKYYDSNRSTWVPFVVSENMNKSTYDSTNKNMSPYTYLNNQLSTIASGYSEYLKHKANELENIHLTSEERYTLTHTLLSLEDLDALIAEKRVILDQDMIDEFGSVTGYDGNLVMVNNLNAQFDSHRNNHLGADKTSYWNSKVGPDHTHNLDSNVTISGTDIVSGYVSPEHLPSEIFERIIQVEDLTTLRSGITDEDRASTYHTGNTIVVPLNTFDDDGNEEFEWYKIVDSSKIGTSDYMSGLLRFMSSVISEIDKMDWYIVVNKPSSVGRYGVQDLYTKTEIDTILSDLNSKISVNIIDHLEDPVTITIQYGLDNTGFSTPMIAAGFQCATSYFAANNIDGFTMLKDSYIDLIIRDSTGVYYRSPFNENTMFGLEFVIDEYLTDEMFLSMFTDEYGSDFCISNDKNPNWKYSGAGICNTNISSNIGVQFTGDFTPYQIDEVIHIEGTIDFRNGGYISFTVPRFKALTSLLNNVRESDATLSATENYIPSNTKFSDALVRIYGEEES